MCCNYFLGRARPKDNIPTVYFTISSCEMRRVLLPLLFFLRKAHTAEVSYTTCLKVKPFKMSTTTMHFGPEWMRTKHQSVPRSQPPPSPPPTSSLSGSGLSTYSALVSATPPIPFEKTDEAHPFRYSKEELLRIYQEGGGKGGLGLEVERWEGVVRELGEEPIALRELNDGEKKVCGHLKPVNHCLAKGTYTYLAFCRAFKFRIAPSS